MNTASKRDQIVAAEYVLRLLSPAQEKHFESQLLDQPELEDMVRQWVNILAPLSTEIAEITPHHRVKQKMLAEVLPSETDMNVSGGLWGRLSLWRTAFSG